MTGDIEPALWTSTEPERPADPAPVTDEPARSPWLRRLVLLVLVAIWIFVLFTEIFPRLEGMVQDPSIETPGLESESP